MSGNIDEIEVFKVNIEIVICEENFENKCFEIVVKIKVDDEIDEGIFGYSEVVELKEEFFKIELVIDNVEVMFFFNCEE